MFREFHIGRCPFKLACIEEPASRLQELALLVTKSDCKDPVFEIISPNHKGVNIHVLLMLHQKDVSRH